MSNEKQGYLQTVKRLIVVLTFWSLGCPEMDLFSENAFAQRVLHKFVWN